MARTFALILVLALVPAAAAAADDALNETVKKLELRIQELEAQLKKLAPAAASAEAPKPAAAPAEAPAAQPAAAGGNGNANGKTGFLWSAYLDGYYGYNFNRPASRVNQLRNFDLKSNQFQLNYSELVLERPAEPLGFRLDIGFGETLHLVHATEPSSSGLFRHLQQAYVSYKAPVGKGLQLDFGKFVTSLGAEVIETRDNYNYSRSLMFAYSIPYYHFGLRATYPLSSTLTIGGQVVNGWNNVSDNNTGKTYVGTVSWTPVKRVTLVQNFITGPERLDDNRGRRNVWDTVVMVTASDKLTFLANYDYGQDRPDGVAKARWTGVAGAARWTVNPWFTLAPRLEWYNDADGFTTGVAQKVKEATLTAEFKVREGLITRLEYRRDWSDQPFFDRRGNPGSSREQNTILGGLIFYFASPR